MSHFDLSHDDINSHGVLQTLFLKDFFFFKQVHLFDHICSNALNPHTSQNKKDSKAVMSHFDSSHDEVNAHCVFLNLVF